MKRAFLLALTLLLTLLHEPPMIPTCITTSPGTGLMNMSYPCHPISLILR